MNIQKPEWFTREELSNRALHWSSLTKEQCDETYWWLTQSTNADYLMAEWIFVVDRMEAMSPEFEDERDPLWMRPEALSAVEELMKHIDSDKFIHSSRRLNMITLLSNIESCTRRGGVSVQQLLEDFDETIEYLNKLVSHMNLYLSTQNRILRYSLELLIQVPYYKSDSNELVYRDVIKILPLDPNL